MRTLLLPLLAAVAAATVDVRLASTNVTHFVNGVEYKYGGSSNFALLRYVVFNQTFVYSFAYTEDAIQSALVHRTGVTLTFSFNLYPSMAVTVGQDDVVIAMSFRAVDVANYEVCLADSAECPPAVSLVVTGGNFSVETSYAVNMTTAFAGMTAEFVIIATVDNVAPSIQIAPLLLTELVFTTDVPVVATHHSVVTTGATEYNIFSFVTLDQGYSMSQFLFSASDGTLILMTELPAFVGTTLFTRSLSFPHGLTVGFPFTRILVRMMIPRSNETATRCWSPISSPTCACQTMATVDLYSSTFVITGRFECQTDTGLIYLTPIDSATQGLPGNYLRLFPIISTLDIADITVTTNWTTFADATTSTSSTSPPPAVTTIILPPTAILVHDSSVFNIGEAQFPSSRLLAQGDVYIYNFEHEYFSIGSGGCVDVTFEFSRHSMNVNPYFDISMELVSTDQYVTCLLAYSMCNGRFGDRIESEQYQDGNYFEATFEVCSDLSITGQVSLILRVPEVSGSIAFPFETTLQFDRPGIEVAQTTSSVCVNNLINTVPNAITELQWQGPSLVPDAAAATKMTFFGSFSIIDADLMTIDIVVPHSLTNVEPFQRQLLRMSVLGYGESSECLFPITSPTCACTSFASVDVNSTTFLIRGRFACTFRSPGNSGGYASVFLTRIGGPLDPDVIPADDATSFLFYTTSTLFESVEATTSTTTTSPTATLTMASTTTTSTTSSTLTLLSTTTTTTVTSATSLSTTTSATTTLTSTTSTVASTSLPTTTQTSATSQTTSATSSSSASTTTTTTSATSSLPTAPVPVPFNASDYRVEALGGATTRAAAYSAVGGAAAFVATVVAILWCVL